MIGENDLTAAYMAGLADRDDAMRKACVAAAVKALREAADVAWCETCTDDMRIKEWLRARADAMEKGEA